MNPNRPLERRPPPVVMPPVVPEAILALIRKFIIDKTTGNIIVQVKDGRVMGAREERIHSM